MKKKSLICLLLDTVWSKIKLVEELSGCPAAPVLYMEVKECIGLLLIPRKRK